MPERRQGGAVPSRQRRSSAGRGRCRRRGGQALDIGDHHGKAPSSEGIGQFGLSYSGPARGGDVAVPRYHIRTMANSGGWDELVRGAREGLARAQQRMRALQKEIERRRQVLESLRKKNRNGAKTP
jgi:hypothetical protein